MATNAGSKRLREANVAQPAKVLNPQEIGRYGGITPDRPVLVILAAGKGTRFGQAPKCAQPVCGIPLARHSIDAFRRFREAPVICLVGYRHDEVMTALGDDNVYVLSENPTGGTALAAYEAFSVTELDSANPLLIITMGDRIVTQSVYRRLYETHTLGPREADLTLLTAIYEPPRHRGKGRIVRDADRRVLRIVEQRDIDALEDGELRQQLLDTTEGNCPLYCVRAKTLRRYLGNLSNDNAQGQYYLTDIVEAISRDGGDIRTITTTVADPEYDLLCSDVTRPMDLARLEGVLVSATQELSSLARIEDVLERVVADRPVGQVASIAAQLEELMKLAEREDVGFRPDQPVGIGVAGGRVRIAFMHPDMGRFFGPAWQMPFGARDEAGREQIVILVQSSDDGKIYLYPSNPQFREKLNFVPADEECMYPGEDVADLYAYEGFGTHMAESLLLSLGYFTDEELQARREKGLPLPPPSLWLGNSMRRPFSLVGNAIASMRTLRDGNLGAKVQTYLGRDGFRGLRVMSTGSIPQGGFSSSSAVTVAVKNAINALFDLGIAPEMLVHLACQAEYGTGVRAGALDQATIQSGRPGQGTLISSNPRENYRILGTYPVPADRFHVIFAYSVDRDRTAWQWSAGAFAGSPEPDRLTAAELRKMTGKASELAALITRLPLDQDFFQFLQQDLCDGGLLSADASRWIEDQLKRVPLRATQAELRDRVQANRHWYIEQLMEVGKVPASVAAEKADATIDALFAGWRDPTLRRTTVAGEVVEETGVPLRAMVAYLFAEVAKNFYLIFHPDEWITCVTRSQRGDCWFHLEPDRLPARKAMLEELDWEKGLAGPELMEAWLQRFGATPFDYNRGLDDASLTAASPTLWHEMPGTNFFRGLALIDLAEAMLKRAFGHDAVAVRVNAAGQGDYFQIHIDTEKVSVEAVKDFIERALYRRFGLKPPQPFVEPHPGGGAVGVRLSRFDKLPELIARLRDHVARQSAKRPS
ncbi:MAG: NTP transferase domain-containing protein [Planctomycetes bacterium]|nr:NTP transferase domain-containing protein [Planctomycetota bacterium]